MKERSNNTCANCGTVLRGEFCSACGQKRFVESDRRFGNLAQQFVESATDLDGRLWGTLRALLFQPGLLSRDYMDGKRVRWMSPIALFLLVNLVYFFSALQSDFATPFSWEVPGEIKLELRDDVSPEDAARLLEDSGPFHSIVTVELIQRRIEERNAAALAESNGTRGYGYRDYQQEYDAAVPEVSKALAILHVPLLALALMLLFRKKQRYYAEHFVVALHLIAFYMAAILVFGYAASLLHLFIPTADWHNDVLNWVIRIALTTYIVIALHRAYSVGWGWSAAATLGLFGAYVLINFYLYRPALFLTVFALT